MMGWWVANGAAEQLAEKVISHARETAGAEQAAEKLILPAEISQDRPPGAEAQYILPALSARLKSCPFKTPASIEFLRSL
jgi:hypothetical protein